MTTNETVIVPPELGVLPLRNSVLFPNAIMPISVGRRKTLNLLDDVVGESKLIAVVSQAEPVRRTIPIPRGCTASARRHAS
jgi:ATP-dependent Lon protease